MGLFKKRVSKNKDISAPVSTVPQGLPNVFAKPNRTISTVVEPWKWLLEASIDKRGGDLMTVGQICELPSHKMNGGDEHTIESAASGRGRNRQGRNVPVACSLRIEVQDEEGRLLLCVHGSSEAFSGLDDKDELVRTFQRCRCEELEITPPSRLISWDVTKEECMNVVGKDMPKLTASGGAGEVFAVLKEPMGSRGTGIFFVQTWEEIHSIIKDHRKRAVEEPNFLDNLISSKGRIPSWVLQAEVLPCMLIRDRRKFHIRTYVLGIEEWDTENMVDIFVYKRHEVRIASEPVALPGEDFSRQREAHITNAAGNSKIGRDLMKNIPELCDLRRKLEIYVAEIFGKNLMKDISRRVAMSAGDDESQFNQKKFALAGLDIMMTEDKRMYLLEVNVNPTIPPPDVLTEPFQEHLQGFMGDMVDILVGRPSSNFVHTDQILN